MLVQMFRPAETIQKCLGFRRPATTTARRTYITNRTAQARNSNESSWKWTKFLKLNADRAWAHMRLQMRAFGFLERTIQRDLDRPRQLSHVPVHVSTDGGRTFSATCFEFQAATVADKFPRQLFHLVALSSCRPFVSKTPFTHALVCVCRQWNPARDSERSMLEECIRAPMKSATTFHCRKCRGKSSKPCNMHLVTEHAFTSRLRRHRGAQLNHGLCPPRCRRCGNIL